MKIKDITEWVGALVKLFLGLAPCKQPDNNSNYENDQQYSRPDSRLEDIANRLTASRATAQRKKNKKGYEECFIIAISGCDCDCYACQRWAAHQSLR